MPRVCLRNSKQTRRRRSARNTCKHRFRPKRLRSPLRSEDAIVCRASGDDLCHEFVCATRSKPDEGEVREIPANTASARSVFDRLSDLKTQLFAALLAMIYATSLSAQLEANQTKAKCAKYLQTPLPPEASSIASPI